MEGQSLTEMRTGGGGGGNTNWKTLADVKTEHLGHGEKVHMLFDTSHTCTLWICCSIGMLVWTHLKLNWAAVEFQELVLNSKQQLWHFSRTEHIFFRGNFLHNSVCWLVRCDSMRRLYHWKPLHLWRTALFRPPKGLECNSDNLIYAFTPLRAALILLISTVSVVQVEGG